MDASIYRDYRKLLRDVLEDRMRSNSRYSLRAFARDISLSPQMLSHVMSGKKGLSLDRGLKVAERLGMDPLGAEHFGDLITLAQTKSPDRRQAIEVRLRASAEEIPYARIDADIFRTMADWVHYALLELVETDDFEARPEWIAKRLGIRIFEAEQALARLLNLGLLVRDSKGRLARSHQNLTATFAAPNSALRKLAKQYLERAIDALETQALDERDVTNVTMSIDPSLLPEAKKKIAKFRRDLCRFLESGSRKEVYVFSPVLFRLSRPMQELNS